MENLKPSLRKRQKRRDKRMHEELIECYRSGWKTGKLEGYQKKYVGREFEYALKKEGMKLRNGGTKYPNDNLQPLIRFLHSKVGKFWDKVYAELCEKMDKNSMLGKHLFQHLAELVETKAYFEDGKIMGTLRGKPQELASGRWGVQFYVHPKSGVLMKIKRTRKY